MRARIACKNTGISEIEHFPNVRKMIKMPKGVQNDKRRYLKSISEDYF